MTLEVVVLAAGEGRRMKSDTPKVLHQLAGRPLLAHVLGAVRALAPSRIVVVHGHGGERVRSAFPEADLEWVEQAERRGTGHAVAQALPRLDPRADVLVVYGDVPLVRSETLRRLVDEVRGGLAILVAEAPDPTGYGRIVRGEDRRVVRVVEQPDATEAETAICEVNTGLLATSVAHLARWLSRIGSANAKNEYYLTDAVALAVDDGVAVATVRAPDWTEVAGVNSRGDLAALERAFQRREAAALLAAGVSLADPERLDLRGTLACGRDVWIDVGCVFEGRVQLGDRVRVGPYCVLRDVSVGADTEVLAFSHLEGAQVGARCRVGPYARLRPGARLAERVHVGNFVEVKAAALGAGAKANHLAYLGDAELGAETNVGAGTITCNYDGERKHRTVIEDGCFIGSNATLVAPLRLARGTYVAAGSTVTQDTPPDSLVFGRAHQTTKAGRRSRRS